MKQVGRLLGAVRRRQRMADAAFLLARWALPTGLLIIAVALVAIKRWDAPPELLWLTVLPIPILVTWAFARPRSLRATARLVDHYYGLDDRIGSALELASSTHRGTAGDPRTEQIVQLLAHHSEQLAAGLDPRPVVRLRLPGPRWVDVAALTAVAGAMFTPPVHTSKMQAWFHSPELRELLQGQTRAGVDLALALPLRQNLRELTQTEDAPARIAERILDVLEGLESGELDRAEAFAELERLEELLAEAEQQLQDDLTEDPGMLAEAIRDLAEGLQEHDVTEDAGRAFEQGRPDEAEQALDAAAEAAEQGGKTSDEAMRQAMVEAERRLGEAAKQNSDTAKEQAETERRLRKEQQREASDPAEQERRLQKMKERVEQLRRKHEQEKAAQRRLEQLQRQAKEAASAGASAAGRKSAVQKLSRSASGAARSAQRSSRTRQARDGLEEAKTIVRRAGKQGESDKRRSQQVKKFSKAAKGKKGDGKSGEPGKSTLLVEGQVGEGEPDMMMEMPGDGQGREGDGQGDGQDEGDGQGEGQDGDGQGDAAGNMPGDGIGDGTDDSMGDPRGSKAAKKNVHVAGRQGRGVTRAEVIKDSSQQGFATEAYRDVYTDYRAFAQSAMDNEALPPAKRRAIKRYYQLILPRD